MTSNLKWVESWKPINSTTGVAYVSKCHSTLTTVEWLSKLIPTHTHTHIYCCWLYDIGNIGIRSIIIGNEVTTISIFFYSSKTFLHTQRLLVIELESHTVYLSLAASFYLFSFLMECALMKYWLETPKWLSQLFLKVDNHHLMCKFWSRLIDICM